MDRACRTYDPPNLFLLGSSDRQASGTTTPTVIIADRRCESRIRPGLSWAITPRREVIQDLYPLYVILSSLTEWRRCYLYLWWIIPVVSRVQGMIGRKRCREPDLLTTDVDDTTKSRCNIRLETYPSPGHTPPGPRQWRARSRSRVIAGWRDRNKAESVHHQSPVSSATSIERDRERGL